MMVLYKPFERVQYNMFKQKHISYDCVDFIRSEYGESVTLNCWIWFEWRCQSHNTADEPGVKMSTWVRTENVTTTIEQMSTSIKNSIIFLFSCWSDGIYCDKCKQFNFPLKVCHRLCLNRVLSSKKEVDVIWNKFSLPLVSNGILGTNSNKCTLQACVTWVLNFKTKLKLKKKDEFLAAQVL